jgi:hypothetical protein
MLNLTKRIAIQPIRVFEHKASFIQKSIEYNVGDCNNITVFLQMGSTESIAIAASTLTYLIEGSPDKSGSLWTPLATGVHATVTPTQNTLSANHAAGATIINLTSGTGYVLDDLFTIFDAGDTLFATSEICKIMDVVSSSVMAIRDPLQRAHVNTTPTFSKGLEVYNNIINQGNLQRLRVSIRHTNATGPNIVWRASLIAGYSVQ